VFCEVAHQAGAGEDEQHGVDDRALARAVGSNNNVVASEADVRLLNATEVADRKCD